MNPTAKEQATANGVDTPFSCFFGGACRMESDLKIARPSPPNEFGGCSLQSRMNPTAKEQASANGADAPFSCFFGGACRMESEQYWG
jgi:ferredoxin